MQVHIRKARVIDPQSDFHDKVVDLLIEDGIIKNIDSSISAKTATVVEAKGLLVSPGWIDVFADYREPGFEQKESISTGLAAAASGGFAHVLLAPNTQPVLSSKSAIQFVQQRAAGNIVTLLPIGSATQNAEGKDLAEMMDMCTNGAVAFSDGWKPVQNSNLMLKALEYVKAFKSIIIQLPVDATLASGGLMNEGVVSTTLGMPGIPMQAETIMLHRDIELARYTRSRLHVTGISTAASVDMIRKAKAEGLAVTCSVTPYHLSLTDEVLKSYDSGYKVSPPLRTEIDRQALITGLKDGTIDCIASHHRPHEWDAKAKEFEYAADGMAVQEIAFNILWEAVKDHIDIDRLIEAMTTIPADIFRLQMPVIKKGNKACLTMFTTTGTTTLLAGHTRSKGVNNPFLGKKLSGKVLGIINNNQLYLNN
jgi:dihydroorotase